MAESFDSFQPLLDQLIDEAVLPEAIEGLNTLIVYINNLLTDHQDPKYHKISAVNIHFIERLGHLALSTEVLDSIGFKESTTPVKHYRFDSDLFNDESINTTKDNLKAMLQYTTKRRDDLAERFKKGNSHIENHSHSNTMSSVKGLGFHCDRGRRTTMEDKHTYIDNFISNVNNYMYKVFSQSTASSSSSNESDTPTPPLFGSPCSFQRQQLKHLEKMSPKLVEHAVYAKSPLVVAGSRSEDDHSSFIPYSNVGFYAVYDGHGGRDAVDFVVNSLHQNIAHEIREFIATGGSSCIPFPLDVYPTGTETGEYSGVPCYEYYTASDDAELYNHHRYSPLYIFTTSLVRAYERTDHQLRRAFLIRSGTTTATSIVGYYGTQRFLITANVGDSRAILAKKTCMCHYRSFDQRYDNSVNSLFEPLRPDFPQTADEEIDAGQFKSKLDNFLALSTQSPHVDPVRFFVIRQRGLITQDEITDPFSILFDPKYQYTNLNSLRECTYIPPTALSDASPSDRSSNANEYLSMTSDFLQRYPEVVSDKFTTSERLTLDHKATLQYEIDRIQSQGGFVSATQPRRVNGVLAITRALGDHYFKENQQLVSNRPHIDFQCIDETHPFLLLACDGVWDVLQDHQAMNLLCNTAIEFTKQWLTRYELGFYEVTTTIDTEANTVSYSTTPIEIGDANCCDLCLMRAMPPTIMNQILALASTRIVTASLARGTNDNVSVVAVHL